MHLAQGRRDALFPVEDGEKGVAQRGRRRHVRRQTGKGIANKLSRVARQAHAVALGVVKDRHEVERLISKDFGFRHDESEVENTDAFANLPAARSADKAIEPWRLQATLSHRL